MIFDIIMMYGHYIPQRRWNVDQVPLEFASKPKRVIDFKGAKQVWVSCPSAGLQKRQCTLILCFNGKGDVLCQFYRANFLCRRGVKTWYYIQRAGWYFSS